MIRRVLAAGLLAAVTVLAGCSAPAEPNPSSSPTSEPTAAPTPETSAPTETPPPTDVSAAGPPELCIKYVAPEVAQADGGAGIAEAAARAELPAAVVLNPGVQTITSVDRPGMIEAVVRVCSDPMTEAELVDVASAIAVAIKSDPASELLSVLVVSSWSPGEGEYLQQDESVTSDFQLYTWDPGAGAPLSSNWD